MDIQRSLVAVALCGITLVGCATKQATAPQAINIIPKPVAYSVATGSFSLPSSVSLSFDHEGAIHTHFTDYLNQALGERCHRSAKMGSGRGTIHFVRSMEIKSPEEYQLEVNQSGVEIKASSPAGFFYGIQSLLQLVGTDGSLPIVKVQDKPRFGYRGLMLDVSRHFMSKEFIKQLLSEMAHYKLNRFHLHLVDGGGWRMQSEAYPLLTKKAAFRTQKGWDEWWTNGDRRFVDEGTAGAYGGYYTKEDLREIVDYARGLQITIVPEIELPGHSNEIFAAYPELTCEGKWSRDASDVCIGKEEVFTFFERILDETMELFPSEYIHIGGDEAAMNHWANCPNCQKRMKTEGLKDVHELQSYMIRRIERYLKSKGRKLIGWDEILMGGLAPDATVMSWRGEEGGIKAASAGHDVIMTPNGNFYLDYYQANPKYEPRAIGGYVPLEKVYRYNPAPNALASDKLKHILGVQANLWTEYIEDGKHAAYMYFPRALAVSEVGWSGEGQKDYTDFRRRATLHTDALLSRGFNAYPLKGIFTQTETDRAGKRVSLTLTPERAGVELRYTTDGTEPTANSPLYQSPISTADSALVTAHLFRGQEALEYPSLHYRIDWHKGITGQIKYNCQINPKYPAGGEQALIDGRRGTLTYLDKLWQGFTETMDVTIDLGEVKPIRHIFARFMQEKDQWVYMPADVEVWVSQDGKTYTSLGKVPTKTSREEVRPTFETFDFYTHGVARYVRMRAANNLQGGYFIFTDEVVIQ